MEISGKKKASVALLSILIPISLLTTSRLTGIMYEPLAPETVQVDTVNWAAFRPSQDDETVFHITRNVYQDVSALIELNVTLCKYVENDQYWPFEGNDGFILVLTATADLSNGFVHSVVIRFCNSDSDAILAVHKDPDAMRLLNIDLKDIVDLKPTSSVTALGVNQPSSFMLELFPLWVFYDQNNVSHQMTVTLETIYFNGANYLEIVMPIQLEVVVS